MSEPVYIIATQTRREYYDGGFIEEEVDPAFGYFTSLSDAASYVERLDRPVRERYERHYAEFLRQRDAWKEKQERAKAFGFTNPDPYPTVPEKPLGHLIVPIMPGPETNNKEKNV
jgi:hypothetical protein